MKISVVTITFNNLDELKSTLSSIPQDDFIESIIINGGESTDTRAFLKSYNGIVLTEKDEGIADAFNKGLKLASGEAVLFLNSGDILLDKTYLEKAAEFLTNNNNIDFVHSNILFVDEISGGLVVKPPMKNLGRGMKYLHPTMIVKKKVFKKIGDFNKDYKIAMDYDFVVRMEMNNCKGFYLDLAPVVKMNGHGKSYIEEYNSLKESVKSLKENKALNVENIAGLSIRWALFGLRKMLLSLGGKRLLIKLKHRKYDSATS